MLQTVLILALEHVTLHCCMEIVKTGRYAVWVTVGV